MKHFLKETDFKPHELGEVFSLSRQFKRQRGRHTPPVLAGQTWALLFAKSSTRTRFPSRLESMSLAATLCS